MKLNDRLEKLRHEKKLIIEALRVAEHKASTRQRKRENRAKIILGAVVLSMQAGEREAILSMLLPHTTERDRSFISEHLADDQTGDASPSGLN